eukprot:TRINITY_DN9006_c0_g1_i1.p1 TRINITY_DN9006_c0_g1~~TRINITY_DN9006_c0_g1_i1.p1  ORF type:complete len:312 (-),score=34.68 TRINITY_DN9006_c0_g1_i1:230-1165(-)
MLGISELAADLAAKVKQTWCNSRQDLSPKQIHSTLETKRKRSRYRRQRERLQNLQDSRKSTETDREKLCRFLFRRTPKERSPESDASRISHPLDTMVLTLPPLSVPQSMGRVSPAINEQDITRPRREGNTMVVAYSRCALATIYAQGGFALITCMDGDIMTGIADGMQSWMGYKSVSMDQTHLLPSYTSTAAVKGTLGLYQVVQLLRHDAEEELPLMLVATSALRAVSAVLCWQLYTELHRVESTHPLHGLEDADGTFVKCMSGDWLSWLRPLHSCFGNEAGRSCVSSRFGGIRPRVVPLECESFILQRTG